MCDLSSHYYSVALSNIRKGDSLSLLGEKTPLFRNRNMRYSHSEHYNSQRDRDHTISRYLNTFPRRKHYKS